MVVIWHISDFDVSGAGGAPEHAELRRQNDGSSNEMGARPELALQTNGSSRLPELALQTGGLKKQELASLQTGGTADPHSPPDIYLAGRTSKQDAWRVHRTDSR